MDLGKLNPFRSQATRENAELDTLSPEIVAKETPLSEVPEAQVGSDTATLHFLADTTLGWVAWREREASLAELFERTFAASKFELKMTEDYNRFAIEIDIPKEHVPRFLKVFKGKTLCHEIDKIHGIESSIGRFADVKLSNLKQTMGSTIAYANLKTSIELVRQRVERLEGCSSSRVRELEGIQQVWEQLQTDMLVKLDHADRSIQERMRENVLHKFDAMQAAIVQHVLRDFSFLRLKDFDAIGGKSLASAKDQPVGVLSPPPPPPVLVAGSVRPAAPMSSPSTFFAGASPASLPPGTVVPPATSPGSRSPSAAPHSSRSPTSPQLLGGFSFPPGTVASPAVSGSPARGPSNALLLGDAPLVPSDPSATIPTVPTVPTIPEEGAPTPPPPPSAGPFARSPVPVTVALHDPPPASFFAWP